MYVWIAVLACVFQADCSTACKKYETYTNVIIPIFWFPRQGLGAQEVEPTLSEEQAAQNSKDVRKLVTLPGFLTFYRWLPPDLSDLVF